MKILVTGGAGYLGSVLVPRLLADGHHVTVLDNFMYRQTSLLDCCTDRNLAIVRGDVRDVSTVERLLGQADVVLPLACLTGAPACAQDPAMARAVNDDAVRFIGSRLGSDQRLVFPCTISGYGVAADDLRCDEDTPLRPVSLYARLKVEVEDALLQRGNAVSLRLATLFGTSLRMRLDLLVNDFTYRAMTDRFVVLFEPHFKRNFLHVRDAARAFQHALANYGAMKGQAYNVGLGEANLSKLELCEVIRRHVPDFRVLVSDIGHDPDTRNYIVSTQRIEATGFRPAFGLDEGIEELVKGYQVVRRTQFSNT